MTQNTDELSTPDQIRDQLENEAFFTADRALYVAEKVYQPLYECIKELAMIVDHIEKRGY